MFNADMYQSATPAQNAEARVYVKASAHSRPGSSLPPAHPSKRGVPS